MKELFVDKCFVKDIETNRGLIAYQYAESLRMLEGEGKNSFFSDMYLNNLLYMQPAFRTFINHNRKWCRAKAIFINRRCWNIRQSRSNISHEK